MSDLDVASALTLSVSIIAVILSYIDMRRRLKQEQEASQSMAELINTLREELELFRKRSMTNEELQRQKVLVQREKQQWKQITDIGEAIGWILEYSEDKS